MIDVIDRVEQKLNSRCLLFGEDLHSVFRVWRSQEDLVLKKPFAVQQMEP